MSAQIIAFPARSRWMHPKYPPDLWRKAIEQDGTRAEFFLDLATQVAREAGIKTRLDVPFVANGSTRPRMA